MTLHYAASDCICLPRRRSSLTDLVPPMKTNEALISGVPVVLSDVKAMVELVEDGETALVFPAGDVIALHGALNRLMSDPELARRLAAAAAETVRSERGWAVMAEKMSGLHHALITSE